ncbi:MAG: NUDIX hydrolase [Candidatus Sericytochromatia bacterium]|nr:NUDIX hydrolase [Candidatus Sericytochromatia bacterium]
MSGPGPRIRVGVVLQEGDALLLVEHRKGDRGYWLLPGGGLDHGETFFACAAREVREETGLLVEPERVVYLSEAIAPAGGRHIVNVFVKARVLGGTLTLPDGDIISAARWVPLGELPGLVMYPAIAEVLIASAATGFDHEVRHLGAIWT